MRVYTPIMRVYTPVRTHTACVHSYKDIMRVYTPKRTHDAFVRGFADQGVEVPVVTGAGTGSFLLEGASGVYDEVQPGRCAVGVPFRV